MKVADNGGFEACEPGTHRAICFRVIDIGTQLNEYQGKKTQNRKIILGFELVDQIIQSGEWKDWPYTANKFYTASLGKKANLRTDLECWRGRPFNDEELKGFDLNNILNKPCLINIAVEDGKTKIKGIMAVPKGDKLPPVQHELQFLSLEPGEFNQDVFDDLSDGFKKMIVQSPEYKNLKGQIEYSRKDDAFSDFEDDIPF